MAEVYRGRGHRLGLPQKARPKLSDGKYRASTEIETEINDLLAELEPLLRQGNPIEDLQEYVFVAVSHLEHVICQKSITQRLDWILSTQSM